MKLLVIYEGGYPDPTVTWTYYFNEEVSNVLNGTYYFNEVSNVLNDSRASVSGQHGLNLTLINVTLEDGGIYVLEVENTEGYVELEFNVTVVGK